MRRCGPISWLVCACFAAGLPVLACDDAEDRPCTFNGQMIRHGGSVTSYASPTVPEGQTCLSQTRTCDGGTLWAPTTTPPVLSSKPWSDPAPLAGRRWRPADVTSYATPTVPEGQTCLSQTRTCDDGTLSGTYDYSSCTVQAPPANRKVFASYVSWLPLWVFHDITRNPSLQDAPLQLSVMAPGCPSTSDRDVGLCFPEPWSEQALIADYCTEIMDALENGIDGFIFTA